MKLTLDEIEILIQKMKEADLTKLCLKQGSFELTLEKNLFDGSPKLVHAAPLSFPSDRFPVETHNQEQQTVPKKKTEAKMIVSPMVGTYYHQPSPESPAYVKIGDTIKEGQVVCIIEAMKVMNEIKSDKSGKVTEIHGHNGHPVEFGTPLFTIE